MNGFNLNNFYTVCLIFLIVLGVFGNAHAALNVPLTVNNSLNLERAAEPLSTGVPLPENLNITDSGSLDLFDSSGNKVPAQFLVMSRWRGVPTDATKPIKWVLVTFQATVSSKGTSVYYLKDTDTGGDPATSLSVQNETGRIMVSTGTAKFEISKTEFSLFDNVWIDQDNNGLVNDLIVQKTAESGIELVDANGVIYRSTNQAPEEVVIEENGPLRVVINVRGVFKSQDGQYFAPSIQNTTQYPRLYQPYPHSFVYYNCRLHFYKDKSHVKAEVTIENNGANGRTNPEQYYAPDQTVKFKSINLIMSPYQFTNPSVVTNSGTTPIGSSDSFYLLQDWRENLTDTIPDTLEPSFHKGIYYSIKKNQNEIAAGQTYPGWVALHGDHKAIGVSIKHFWQNFPKTFSITPTKASIGLWPKGGYYPYNTKGKEDGNYAFDGGRHKTYDIALDFSVNPSGSKILDISQVMEQPLMAMAPSIWFVESKALGLIAPYNMSSPDPEIDEGMKRYEKLQAAMVDSSVSENSWTIDNLKTAVNPHWELDRQNRFFSWMNFGDLLWGGKSPCDLHYDWTQKMLLNYVRSGNYIFFIRGEEMARHRYDVDQYHGERTDTKGSHKWVNYFQFYESDGHGDTNYNYNGSTVSKASHTWNGGLSLYYLLTGDKKAWDAAELNARAMVNLFGDKGVWSASSEICANGETRMETWAILNLINAHRISGKEPYLKVALNIAKNRLLYRELQVGGGHWGLDYSESLQSQSGGFVIIKGGCNAAVNTQGNTFYGYSVEPIVTIAYESQDQELNKMIIRMADFLKDKFIFGGDYDSDGKYRPLQTLYYWIEEDSEGIARKKTGEVIKNVFWPDLFAYAYKITKDSEYMQWARKAFRDGMFYYAASGSSYLKPSYRSTISFIDGMFVDSHTKTHGWIGRTNQIYLNTEWGLISGDLTHISSNKISGTYGLRLNSQLVIAGGEGPYSYEIIEGAPNGVLITSQGLLTGLITETGIYNIKIKVSDITGNNAIVNVTLTILPSQPRNLGLKMVP